MQILVTSPGALAPNGSPVPGLAKTLQTAVRNGMPVGVFSNHAKPGWFDAVYQGTGVQFVHDVGRQSGESLRQNAETFNVQPHDALVLATSLDDLQMGKNAGAVLIAGEWSSEPRVRDLGISVANATELLDVLALTAQWPGGWWYKGEGPGYRVVALADLSSMYVGNEQEEFGRRITHVVKQGGAPLKALLAVASRSLLMEGYGAQSDLAWGVYPSSRANQGDNEVLSDFTHRLRTTVSRARYAKRGEPLFVRHRPSAKRSTGGGGDRTDPSGQVRTLHLNPVYRRSLSGRHVVVVDDCTTYGLSFGVAAAFLRAAGCESVLGVALGKFGTRILGYDIEITSDPFAPVGDNFHFHGTCPMIGTNNVGAQQALRELLPA